jgi:hypothetical protein
MREKRVGDLPADRSLWSEDVLEAYEERAAIVEYDAGHDRETAELMAEIGIRQLLAGQSAQP